MKENEGITLVLGGGGAAGAAYIGVLEVFDSDQIPIRRIIGSSAGAFFGSFYASGMAVAEMIDLFEELDHNLLFSWHDIAFSRDGVFRGESITQYLQDHLRALRIEDFPRYFSATATDITAGDLVVLDEGDAVLAVRASVSLPSIFEPVEWEGRQLVDGAYASPLPVDVARSYNDNSLIIAADLQQRHHIPLASQQQQKEKIHLTGALVLATGVLMRNYRRHQEEQADVVLRPAIAEDVWLDFSYHPELIEAGRIAAREALPQIRALLDGKTETVPGTQ